MSKDVLMKNKNNFTKPSIKHTRSLFKLIIILIIVCKMILFKKEKNQTHFMDAHQQEILLVIRMLASLTNPLLQDL